MCPPPKGMATSRAPKELTHTVPHFSDRVRVLMTSMSFTITAALVRDIITVQRMPGDMLLPSDPGCASVCSAACLHLSIPLQARRLPHHKSWHWHAQSPAGTTALESEMYSTIPAPCLQDAPSATICWWFEQSYCRSRSAIYLYCRCQQLDRHLVQCAVGRHDHVRRATLLCWRISLVLGSIRSPAVADCAWAAASAVISS